jgi:hypothetical protein
MKKIIYSISFLLLSVVLVGQDFEVSPLKMFFNAEPGEAQTKFMTVKNHNNKAETFILSISDYSVNSKGEGQYVAANTLKNSIADWVTIAPSFFELNPSEEKEIAITMSQPVDEYGSKWGVIMVRTATEQTAYSADKAVSAGMALSPRIAVSSYQTPGTNKKFQATVSNLTEMESTNDTVRTFSILVNNLGDIITDCKVLLIATNINTAEEFPFPENTFTMYPKSSRKVELYLPKTLPKGTYSLAAILDYGSKTNLEGTQTIIKIE